MKKLVVLWFNVVLSVYLWVRVFLCCVFVCLCDCFPLVCGRFVFVPQSVDRFFLYVVCACFACCYVLVIYFVTTLMWCVLLCNCSCVYFCMFECVCCCCLICVPCW